MEKKIVMLLILLTALIPSVFANGLSIEKVDKGSVVIAELKNPAIFDFVINNPGPADSFQLYSFAGISFSPVGYFDVPSGLSTIQVGAYPSDSVVHYRGNYNFDYQMKGLNYGIYSDSLSINIVELKDTLAPTGKNLFMGDDNAVVTIQNTQKTNLKNINLHLSSAFFDYSKSISLAPYESVDISVPVDKDKLKNLTAGAYVFNVQVNLDSANTVLTGVINYVKEENIVLTKNSGGFIVTTTIYNKTNNGNVPANAKIEITKDIISRLFTTTSLSPTSVDRQGLYTTYSWEKELGPGQSLVVSATTNYTLPFIFILLVIIIALLVSLYTRTSLVLNKRVSFVKTKGGEFALKVVVHVKSNKFVENVQIIDRLPGMTQLYEKFGIKPDRIDASSRRLFWNVDRLNAGEERVYSYIVYSKMRVVGRFELPSASAIYQRDGKTEESFSNRAFFVSEMGKSSVD